MRSKSFILILLILLSSGCSLNRNLESSKKNVSSDILKCNEFECVQLINEHDKKTDIDKKIGIKGKKNQFVDNSYEWKLSDKLTIRVIYDPDGVESIDLLFDNDDIAIDSLNTTFMKTHTESYNLYLSGGVEKASEILNANGTLLHKDRRYNQYIWYKNEKCYVKLKFNPLGDIASSKMDNREC